MIRSQTMYDEVDQILMEYATLVCAVAEIPGKNLEIHRAKYKAVMDLKTAARSVMMDLIEKKIATHKQVSIN